MDRKLTVTVTKEQEEKTLEWVMKNLLGMTKRDISRAKFREKGICINGEKSRVNTRLHMGDYVEILVEEAAFGEEETVLKGQKCPFSILYEDADVLVVNKPAGTPVHPVGCHRENTLSDKVSAYLKAKGENAVARSIGRLDKETSGVVVFSKNRMAAARLQRQRLERAFVKEYLAVVWGHFQEEKGCIRLPLKKMETAEEKARMQVSDDGMEAVTYYQVIAKREDVTVVSCMLETGRTHQIRVHMASIGHPLLGDCIYGNGREEEGERALLHAWKTVFFQPFTGERIMTEAPLPGDIRERIES